MTTSIDVLELDKFSKTSGEWWDVNGEFKILHKINPIRISYLVNKIAHHLSLNNSKQAKPLRDISILDVGAGGGLVSVPLASLGADVTGIDANHHNVQAAQEYVQANKVDATFKHLTVEQLVTKQEQFDVVIALEVIEHVANPREFVQNLTKLAKPGGMIVISTINRTIKSYIFAILMAEYLLRWVPRRTHDHSKFIKPSELNQMLKGTKFSLKELKGLSFELPTNKWDISMNVDVNYFAYIG